MSISKIWVYLKAHVKQDFSWSVYTCTFFFLAISIYCNYTFDIEDSYLDEQTGLAKVCFYFLFYAFAYFTVLALYSVFKKQSDFWSTHSFWLKSIIVLIVLSLDSSRPYLQTFIDSAFHPDLRYYAYKILVNINSLIVVMIPLSIVYYFYDRQQKHLYGLQTKRVDLKPYLFLLALMLPLIIGASFSNSFQRQYPMYKTSTAPEHLNSPEWLLIALYEFVYGADFITVEFLFRGFLVIGLMNYTGRSAVLTMAAVYCFLHFGKPAGEAISSIFGGYILGVITYETKSIWGGIVIHLGVAWGMELAAFVQKQF